MANVLLVHGFITLPPLASPSPFCLKLETWLRLAGIPYKAVANFNPLKAPKGKAPYVTLEDGSVLSDSAHIIAELEKRPEVTLDDDLDDHQRAQALLLQRTVENHLYHALVYTRWVRDEGFAITKAKYFRNLSPPTSWLLPQIARRGAVSASKAEGTGRHSCEEVLAGAREDLNALSVLLADRPYFLGDKAHGVDASLWAHLAQIHCGPFPDALQANLREHPNLVAYCERLFAELWTD